MLHSDIKEEFIRLRAEGKTLSTIAAELKINKNTATGLNRSLAPLINEARALAIESLLQELGVTKYDRIRACANSFKKCATHIEQHALHRTDSQIYSFFMSLNKELNNSIPAIRETRPRDSTPQTSTESAEADD